MRKFLIALLATLTAACCETTPPVAAPNPVTVTTEDTVALLSAENHPFCAGVWVAPRWVLTANHCTEDEPKQIKLGMRHHIGAMSEVRFQDKAHDLALLYVEHPPVVHGIAAIAGTTPAVGEKLRIVGHPSGMLWTYVTGEVAGYRDMGDAELEDVRLATGFEGEFMQIAAPFWYGNSGGGAFNENNELVGIASFRLQMPNSGCLVHVETIRSFVKAHT